MLPLFLEYHSPVLLQATWVWSCTKILSTSATPRCRVPLYGNEQEGLKTGLLRTLYSVQLSQSVSQ